MARSLGTSIDNTRPALPPGLNRRLRRWLQHELTALRPAVAQSAAACHADKYRKHFDSFAHTCLLLFHGLSGSASLRQSYASFSACPGLVAVSGLSPTEQEAGVGVSYPQLAASNSSRPAAWMAGLLPALLARAQLLAPHADLPADLHLLDGTRIKLSRILAPWLTCHTGVGVQVCYVPAQDLPEQVVLMPDERQNDYQGMDRAILDDPEHLTRLVDQTLVFDLGYHSHDRFRHLLDAGVHLVTRYHPQARLEVLDDLPVQQLLTDCPGPRIRVLSDQRILLGSPNNRRTKRLLRLRLVRATVTPLPKAAKRGAKTVTYEILTDRWDLDAHEVVQWYLWRWLIEMCQPHYPHTTFHAPGYAA
jgi:hypothetical protein